MWWVYGTVQNVCSNPIVDYNCDFAKETWVRVVFAMVKRKIFSPLLFLDRVSLAVLELAV